MNATTAELAWPETESNQNMNASTAGLSCPKPNQIKIVLVLLNSNQPRLYCKLCCSNQTDSAQIKSNQLRCMSHNQITQQQHSPSDTCTCAHTPNILEGVRACGKAVPGRHSRLCQSNTSAHLEVTCKGTTTIKRPLPTFR